MIISASSPERATSVNARCLSVVDQFEFLASSVTIKKIQTDPVLLVDDHFSRERRSLHGHCRAGLRIARSYVLAHPARPTLLPAQARTQGLHGGRRGRAVSLRHPS